jgi:hypothetical protein
MLHGKSSFIILRNFTDDSDQLKSRIDDFSEQLYDTLEHSGFDRNLFKIEFVDENNIDGKSISGDTPKIMISIYNKTPLQKINKIITEKKKGKYVTFIDEADLLHKKITPDEDIESTASQLDILVKNSFCSFSVSGTILDCILKNQIKVENLIVLEKPAGYKSHNNFLIEHLTKKCKFSTKIDDDIV